MRPWIFLLTVGLAALFLKCDRERLSTSERAIETGKAVSGTAYPRSSSIAENFFPIGAWFPFGRDSLARDLYSVLQSNHPDSVEAILQQVKDAGFNVVHAPHLSDRKSSAQTVDLNANLLNAAHARGLKVQLYAWQHPIPYYYWTRSRFWCRTVDMKAHNINVEGQLHLKGNYGGGGYENHRFYLRTDEPSEPNVVAVIEVLDGNHTVASRSIRGEDFRYPSYHFDLTYNVKTEKTLTYRVEYTGEANLWVEKVRAYGGSAYRLLDGHYDQGFNDIVDGYDSYPALWRFYLADEPWWDVHNESIRYMGKSLELRGKLWQVANFYYRYPRWLNKFVEETQPPELLVDPYPFSRKVPKDGGRGFQGAIDRYAEWLSNSKGAASLGGIPLWVIIQTHSWGNDLREPSARELRLQANMVLAYGAKGIFYFTYASFPANSCIGLVIAPGPGNAVGKPTEKWYEVRDFINPRLEKWSSTLLKLKSDKTFCSEDTFPDESFIESISGAKYIHIGTFKPSAPGDSTRYFMLVNRKCRENETQSVEVTMDPGKLEIGYGEGPYLVNDVYTGEIWDIGPDESGNLQFTTSLLPGEGKLFSIKR